MVAAGPDDLLAGAGAAALAEVTAALAGGAGELKVAETLRARYDAGLVAAAMTQVGLRARAAAKFASADRMLFTRAGLEQASGDGPGAWRADRLGRLLAVGAAGDGGVGSVADLCCGIGGDLGSLAKVLGPQAVFGVDLDETHARLARHNSAVAAGGVAAAAVRADVRDLALGPGVAAAFVDPARRDDGKRLGPKGYLPPLGWCLALADAVPIVVVKAAPGIDVAEVPAGWELEFVAEGGELKESVVWSPGAASAVRRASVLPGGHTLTGEPDPLDGADVRPLGRYLLDPSPAVTRAGLVRTLAGQVGGWQIDARIGFLTADRAVPTPYGRWWEVAAAFGWNDKRLREVLRELDVGAVDLRRRGLAGDVDAIRRRLKLTGSRRAMVAMTRAADQPFAIVGWPVDAGAGSEARSVR